MNTTNLTSLEDGSMLYEQSGLDLFIQNNIGYIEYTLYILYPLIFMLGIIGNSVIIYVLITSLCMKRNIQLYHNNTDNTNLTRNLLSPSPANQRSVLNKFKFGPHKTLADRLRMLLTRFLKEKLTVTNFYLLNLAISDFFYVLFIPFLLCTMIYEKWLFGTFLCKIYFTVAYLCQCSTVYILVVLSVDRYLSVKYPLKVASFRSDKKARMVIMCTWLFSLVYVTPIFFATKKHHTTCNLEWPESWNFTGLHANKTSFMDYYLPPLHAFTVYTIIINYLIPVSTIVILYTLILRLLRIKEKKNTIKQSKTKKKSNKRITKMVLAIIICYIMSWSPYWLLQIVQFIYQHILKKNFTLILTVMTHLVQVVAYMSSALNPFIYSYMSEAFRIDLKLVLTNCYLCKKYNSIKLKSNNQIKTTDNQLKELPKPQKEADLGDKSAKLTKSASSKLFTSKINEEARNLYHASKSNFNKSDHFDCYIDEDAPTIVSTFDQGLNQILHIESNNELSLLQTTRFISTDEEALKAENDENGRVMSQKASSVPPCESNLKSKPSSLKKNRKYVYKSGSSFTFEIDFHGISFKDLFKKS